MNLQTNQKAPGHACVSQFYYVVNETSCYSNVTECTIALKSVFCQCK